MNQKPNDYLEHWGILGQKWGLRRFRNPDGTLTEEGKQRYYKKDRSSWKQEDIKKVSDAELVNRTNRLRLEAVYMDALDAVNYPRYLDNHHTGFAQGLLQDAVRTRVIGGINAGNEGRKARKVASGRNQGEFLYDSARRAEDYMADSAKRRRDLASDSKKKYENAMYESRLNDYNAYRAKWNQEQEEGKKWLGTFFWEKGWSNVKGGSMGNNKQDKDKDTK